MTSTRSSKRTHVVTTTVNGSGEPPVKIPKLSLGEVTNGSASFKSEVKGRSAGDLACEIHLVLTGWEGRYKPSMSKCSENVASDWVQFITQYNHYS